MSYLERLKAAKDAIGTMVPGPYLLMLARNPEVRTESEIQILLDSNRSMYDATKLKALALIVARANPQVDSPATDQTPTTEENLNPVETISAINESDTPEALVEDISTNSRSEPITSSASSPIGEKKPSVLDASQLLQIDALFKPKRLIEITVKDEGGKLKLGWPAVAGFPIFAIATSEGAFAKSLARAAWYAHTRDTELEIDTDHDFFSVFGFEAEGLPGVLLGFGRRLREVSRLQVEEFQSQIRLLWTVEDQSAKVVIYKSQANQALSNHPSADRIVAESSGDGSFVDEKVSPGEDYEYRACVQWEGPGRVLTTAGKAVTAGVYAPVPDVEDFTVLSNESSANAEISFKMPASPAKVRLFQVRGLPQPELLSAHQDTQERDISILSGDELPEWLGTEIIADSRTSGETVALLSPMLSGQIESRTYIAISILGRRFRVMAMRAIPQVGAVTSLQLIDRYDYQILRAATPPGAQYLEVWIAGQGANFDQISKLPPDRQVQLIDEYRKFGGIVFSDNLLGVSGSASLGSEPKEIFVRGATNFEGVKHVGPISLVTHLGQIAVSFSRIEIRTAAESSQKSGFFGKRPVEFTNQPPRFALALKCSAPNRFGGNLTLRHLAGSEFPLDTATPESKLFDALSVGPGDYEETKPYRDESGQTRQLDPALRHRLQLIADSKGNIQGFPSFTVDTFPDQFSAYRQGANSINAELKVVILGSKQSGKTTYIQALLNYMQHQFASLYVAKLLAASGDSWAEKRLQEMESFVKTGALPPATRTAKPFFENPNLEDPNSPNPMRQLNFEMDNGSQVPLRKLGIVDVAGEDMDQLETMSYYEQSIMNADLVILLADPLQLGPVQVAMAGLPLPPKGTDPHIVLKNLNELISRSSLDRNPNQKFAVVFSKFDGFQTLSQMEASPISGLIQNGMAITRDPNSFSTRLYNDADGALVQQEILAIMNRLQLAPFVKLLENTVLPNKRRFFVASSLGHSSHSDVMGAAGLTSWRISDPIRWAIHNS